jgi:aspartate/methionine/tyrosine aminotransferase
MGGVVIRFSIKTRNYSTRPTFDLDEMEALVTPRTRMLSICNPHNPLGRAWSLKELRDLVDFAERHELRIVSDEVWGDMVHAPRIHIPTACVSPYAASNTYSIYGFSKSHGLEGLRIGALVAPNAAELTKVLKLSHTDTTANGASVIAQVAAIAAITEAGSWLVSWKLHLHACVKHAVTRLNKMEGVNVDLPESCFVIWVDVSSILYPLHNQHLISMSDNDNDIVTEEEGEEPEMKLMQWLIHEHKVCIIPGLDRFFGPGSKGHIRISVATSKAILDTGLDRLELGLKLWPQRNSTTIL